MLGRNVFWISLAYQIYTNKAMCRSDVPPLLITHVSHVKMISTLNRFELEDFEKLGLTETTVGLLTN